MSSSDATERKPRAATSLPGFGDPVRYFKLVISMQTFNLFFVSIKKVLAVDVTADGQWILATCKTYLMVIPTKIDGTTGFEKVTYLSMHQFFFKKKSLHKFTFQMNKIKTFPT